MIANRLGMSQAALFKRFGTKERLFVAALRRPISDNPLAAVVNAGPSDAPIRDQLIIIGQGILAVMRSVVPCMAMLHAAGFDPKETLSQENAPPIQGRKLLTAWLQRAMDQGRIQPADPQVLAVGFIGMLKARPFRETILGDHALDCSDADYVTQLVDQLWTGIAGENP
jgi:AcrR family transcriptional regulator